MRYLIIIGILFLSGCANTIDSMRDTSLTEGCAIVEADARLGWMNQEGGAVVCKIKCTPNFSDEVEIDYENTRSGCKITRKK